MKKVAMFTMGTRGDVQPYIYLAQELTKRGYEVYIGSNPYWGDLIRDSGVKFLPIGPDIDIEEKAAAIRARSKNPALSTLRMSDFIYKLMVKCTDDIYGACHGKDLIIVSHSQMGSTEAEELHIPTVSVTLQPEMIPQSLKKPTIPEKVIGGMIARQVAKPYNKLRKMYGLKPAKDIGGIMSRQYDLIPISELVTERDPYWEPHHVLTGFWYRDDEDYKPDKQLEKFLESGEKPILLALGSMSIEDKAETDKLDMFVKAFEKTGNRAIIQGFQKSVKRYELPDTMIAIGSVPHSYLIDKCSMVFHHCGFGTAAATLIYGVPSVPVPHVLDQHLVAQKLVDSGVATEPLDGLELNEDDIISRIHNMEFNYGERSRKAKELSEKIREERGLEKAVEYIIEVVPKA